MSGVDSYAVRYAWNVFGSQSPLIPAIPVVPTEHHCFDHQSFHQFFSFICIESYTLLSFVNGYFLKKYLCVCVYLSVFVFG